MNRTGGALTALAVAAALATAGCGGSSSSGPSTPTPSPSASSSATPSSSPSASPSSTPSTSATPTTHPTVSPWKTLPLTIYYIAVGDNGRSGPLVGCGDSAIATYTAPVRYTDPVGPTMRALLANHRRDIGQSGLINVLYQSRLTYRGYTRHGSAITLYLSGTFQLAGTCDIPRAKAEIEDTAMKAARATKVTVYIDGQTIDQRLSLK